MIFPCTKCGACCRRIKQVVENIGAVTKNSPYYFPFLWNEAGHCEKLTETGRCSVYPKRPLICNVKNMSEHFNIPIDQFINDNISYCNKLIEDDQMPRKFKIPTSLTRR